MTATVDRPDGQTRRRLATRERLYEAAVALITERGYEATTIDEIAARAGTSRRTSFNHFMTKSDITLEWAQRRRTQASDAAAAAGSDGDPLDRLRAYFHALADLTEARPAETKEMLLGYLRAGGPVLHPSPMGQELSAWLAGAHIEAAAAAAGGRLAIAADILHDVYLGVLWRWIRDPSPLPGSFTAELNTVIEVALAGIASSFTASGGARLQRRPRRSDDAPSSRRWSPVGGPAHRPT